MGKKIVSTYISEHCSSCGSKGNNLALLRGEFAYHKVGKDRLIQSFMDSNIY